MFKDRDKQREANRKAQAKFKAKGITEGITNQGITDKGITKAERDGAIEFMAKTTGGAERAESKRYNAKHKGVAVKALLSGGVPQVIGDIGVKDKVLKAEGITKTCKYCFKQLEYAVLECCNDCAEMRSKPVSPARDGHILASRPALEFTGKMTASESEHYRPASELKPGKYNPVSKPGDSHYGQA